MAGVVGREAAAVGVIGVGNMGSAMALRLLECGHRVVVRDIRPEAQAAAVAAGAAASPDCATLARRCGLSIVAVVDAAQCEAVLFGERGVCQGLRGDAAVMICSTIGPHDVESLADRLAALNVPCIDAPVSGGPSRAREGTMSLMVACADAVFERHRPVLHDLSSSLVRLGERIGDGARTKLVNNLLAAVNLAGAAEAMALAERLGLDAQRTLQVFERSSAQSWIGSDRLRRALADDFEPRAHTSLLAKDTALAVAMAAGAGVRPPLGAGAQELFAQACAQGLASLDDASLLTLMRRRFASDC
ncbi:MAG: NAD(P)-dependent oxidoreductase [Burkholderiaceae bacterium]|nr:MAG: NAD(P)-dependent oxidoreductase [Burkholderiaceae bacterium]MBE7425633.1 NAD(P)-dependent oxidoreductase [Ideonella sp.]MCC7288144.1 NAD(P)-dependent oxidoreductase [Burkholderiaceae bacterium]